MHLSLRILALVASATALQAWGPGTHTYVAYQLKEVGTNKAELLYGAIAPDFNLLKSMSATDPLFLATHYQALAPWEVAVTPQERALAWGFASHNEAWGADHTAHIASLTLADTSQGYVIQKAAVLKATLEAQLTAAGMTGYLGLITPDNCHFILEYGIDLLARNLDPYLGAKLVEAASHRSPAMGSLMARAYAPGDLGGGATLAYMEGVWRTFMVRYGHILKELEAKALPMMADFLVDLGIQLQVLPPVPPDQRPALVQLIGLALTDSITICASDYPGEIGATIQSLRTGPLSGMDR
ncbi:hypothetical protein [Geothrix fuzhouensis]|uniref:hypothetical protein n=1 Tax=Geothrix fuzhouensis TaxID=2966451 RepID=UPI0021479C21|nr:hypothetical protein [Geothrix fuzhouensis]